MSIYPPFTDDQLHHLPNLLSAPRFATYLQARGGDRSAALALYRWNLEISSASLVPLHVLEVTLRNAIVEAIEGVHGGAWPWSAGFLRSLPNPQPPIYSPARDLKALGRRHQNAGQVIADLKFVFWEKMLTSRYQCRLAVLFFGQAVSCWHSCPRSRWPPAVPPQGGGEATGGNEWSGG